MDLLPPKMGVRWCHLETTLQGEKNHNFNHIAAQGAHVQTQSSRAAIQMGFVACQAHTAIPTFLSEVIFCLVGLKTRLDSGSRGSDLDTAGWDEFWKKLFSWQELNYCIL